MTITITAQTITNTITGILFLSASLWFTVLAIKNIVETMGSIVTIISRIKNRCKEQTQAQPLGIFTSEESDKVLERWNREVEATKTEYL
jgi:hypothetical protein